MRRHHAASSSAHIDRLALSLHNGSGRLVWIGDSITSQHFFWATACMPGAALPPPRVWLNGRTFTPASTRALAHSSLRPSLLRLASSQPATKSSGGRRSDSSSSNSDSICVFVATRIGRLQLCHVLHKVSSSWPGAHASLGALFNALAASGGLSQKDVVIANSGLNTGWPSTVEEYPGRRCHVAARRLREAEAGAKTDSSSGGKPRHVSPTHDGDYAPGGFPPSSTCNGSSALSTPLRHATTYTSADAVPAGSYNAISNPLVVVAGVPILHTYDLRTHRPSDHIGWSERRRATGDVVREVLDCVLSLLPTFCDAGSLELRSRRFGRPVETGVVCHTGYSGTRRGALKPPTIAARPLEATKASSSTQLLGMQEDDSLPDAIAQLARELGVQDAVIQRMKKLETRRVHARIGERSLYPSCGH